MKRLAMFVLVITLCLISVEIVEAGRCGGEGECVANGCSYTIDCCKRCSPK